MIRECVSALLLQNEVIPIPVQPTDTRTYIPTSQEMEEAVLAAESKGVHARMLLVTNPGNPLGTLYPEATLKVMITTGPLFS